MKINKLLSGRFCVRFLLFADLSKNKENNIISIDITHKKCYNILCVHADL